MLTLRVRDLERSLQFWHGRLGIPLKLRTPKCAELQTETVLLVLAEGEPSPGSSVLAWEVADLDGARAEMEARGIACAPCPVPEGADPAAFGRRLAFEDPDGHRLEMACWEPR